MKETDSTARINPYQPPATTQSELEAATTATIEHESIAFAGTAGIHHLRQLLISYDNLGWYPIVTGVIFLSLLQLWAVIVSGILAVVVAGGALFVVLMAITSSGWYRVRVFQSSHPLWNQRCEGELTSNGLHVQRVTDRSFYRWHFFAGVVITDQVVAFMPAVESETPVMIGPDMLAPSVAFEDLKAFARRVKVVCEGQFEGQSVGWANQLVMLARDRERTRTVPDDAIKFQGMIRGADVNDISREVSRAIRPMRAKVVRAGIGFALGLVGVGVIAYISFAMSMMVVFPASIMLLLAFAVWMLLLQADTRRVNDDDELYFLIAHADETGITTDFFVSVTTSPWSNLRVAQQLPDRLVIGQKLSPRLMIARKDMFETSDNWNAFCDLVDEKTRR